MKYSDLEFYIHPIPEFNCTLDQAKSGATTATLWGLHNILGRVRPLEAKGLLLLNDKGEMGPKISEEILTSPPWNTIPAHYFVVVKLKNKTVLINAVALNTIRFQSAFRYGRDLRLLKNYAANATLKSFTPPSQASDIQSESTGHPE